MRLRSCLLLLICLLFHPVLSAENSDETAFLRIVQWAQHLKKFDQEYTREKVYLHLDNNAYFEGETIWFKAYVLRASTLCPSTHMSKVLYVDLLNAEGELVEHKLLRIDEKGQAEGELELKAPIRSGYYEIRSYTRAMTNWGTEACYSRVIPVFSADSKNAEATTLDIDVPQSESDMPFGHARPMNFDSKDKHSLSFFPEGGNRVEGLQQRIAFQLLNGKGNAVEDTLEIIDESGKIYAHSATESNGMGSFVLPPLPATQKLFARVGNKNFPLPNADASQHYGIAAIPTAEGVSVDICANGTASSQLMGVYVSCRTQPCYFDTLTVSANDEIELFIPNEVLKDGVNNFYLYNADGKCCASRKIWKSPESDRTLQLSVRQNEKQYQHFSPIALDMELSDESGQKVSDATFSVSVRDAELELVASPSADLCTDLLLSSEVRGYISHPEQYFQKNDAAHRNAIDLLLMVQGWNADDFETMDGSKDFDLKQPVEDKLLLNGKVLHDNSKAQPWPDMDLHLQMYSLDGSSLDGDVVTDKEGKFALGSNVDFCGEWIAQITTKETTTDRKGNEKQKKRFSRVTLDRWFAPSLRPYSSSELTLQEPLASKDEESESLTDEDIFQWEDTIPRVLMSQQLHEAVAIHHNKYRGFIGNRYSYNGGEAAGLRHADTYYNIARAVEMRKDAGKGEATIWELMQELTHGGADSYFSTIDGSWNGDEVNQGGYDEATAAQNAEVAANANPYAEQPMSDNPSTQTESEATSAFDGNISNGSNNDADKVSSTTISIDGIPCLIFLNNDLVGYGRNTSVQLKENTLADEFKSAVLMTERKDWMRFWPTELRVAGTDPTANKDNPYLNGKKYYGLFLYERADYYRFKTKRGVDKRIVQGYSQPRKFYCPQYNGIDLPDENDFRRTLCWNPDVTTDENGHASLVFFSNAADDQRLRISVRGVTSDGRFIFLER